MFVSEPSMKSYNMVATRANIEFLCPGKQIKDVVIIVKKKGVAIIACCRGISISICILLKNIY